MAMLIQFETATLSEGIPHAIGKCSNCGNVIFDQVGICGARFQYEMVKACQGQAPTIYCSRCGEKLMVGPVVDTADAKITVAEEEKDGRDPEDNGTCAENTAQS